MARPCAVCRHAERAAIDEALVRGDSLRDVEGHFGKTGTSKSALARHRPHVGRALARAAAARHDAEAETLLSKVERLEADARRLGEKAETEGDLRCALAAVRELLDVVKLQREMTPPPKPTADDVRRVLEWMAEEIDVPVEEIVAESEKFARIQADILAGRTPPHTERTAPAVAVAPVQAAAPSPAPAPPTRA